MNQMFQSSLTSSKCPCWAPCSASSGFVTFHFSAQLCLRRGHCRRFPRHGEVHLWMAAGIAACDSRQQSYSLRKSSSSAASTHGSRSFSLYRTRGPAWQRLFCMLQLRVSPSSPFHGLGCATFFCGSSLTRLACIRYPSVYNFPQRSLSCDWCSYFHACRGSLSRSVTSERLLPRD